MPSPFVQMIATLGCRFFALTFVIAGVAVLAFGIRDFQRGRASEAWPSVQGTVLTSEVKSSTHRDSDGRSHTSYRVDLEYEYEVGGASFQGDRIRFGATSHNKSSAAHDERKLYPAGKAVTVFYDNGDPGQSVLVTGMGNGVWIALILGTICSVVGSVLFFVLPRIVKRVFGRVHALQEMHREEMQGRESVS